jgi:hypothetical protein
VKVLKISIVLSFHFINAARTLKSIASGVERTPVRISEAEAPRRGAVRERPAAARPRHD